MQQCVCSVVAAQIWQVAAASLGQVYQATQIWQVAAASLGQVYKATLRSSGEEVAI